MSPEATFIFLLLAFVCFVLAAFNVTVRTLNLVAAGLAFWVFVALWAAMKAL